ncbi:S8 family serine peptidase [Polymorphospora sp. NPDC051019]|uniref:S8 family serine peptidase n=1 Tax=Polymorphospora sp. NPDC051019 TaxID=3155725 RepID=UPI003425C758
MDRRRPTCRWLLAFFPGRKRRPCGNSGVPAANTSPARVTQALTVGATDRTDTRPTWSNYGTALDLFAPGVDITSVRRTSDTATYTGRHLVRRTVRRRCRRDLSQRQPDGHPGHGQLGRPDRRLPPRPRRQA